MGWAVFSLVLLAVFSCKNKTAKKNADPFFPVLPIIRSQVASVDTSLYSIRKITYIDSTHSDTVFYKREQFRDLAADFLSLPDITTREYQDRYTEERQFDESINRAIFRYLPVDPDKETIKREQLLIQPGPPEDKITSIIIDYAMSNRDSLVQKNLLWQVDRSFQVTTTKQLKGQAETTTTYKVVWNEENEE